jgi:hypothetical protein
MMPALLETIGALSLLASFAAKIAWMRSLHHDDAREATLPAIVRDSRVGVHEAPRSRGE